MLLGSLYVFQHTQWTLANARTDIVIHGNQIASNEQIRAQVVRFLDILIYKIEPRLVEKKISELAVVKYVFVK